MSPELVKSLDNLAGLYKEQGRYADAARSPSARPPCARAGQKI